MKAFYALPEVDWAERPSSRVLAPILDDICLPPYVGTHELDDYTPLMSVALALQPAVVLELGTAQGNTVANLCRHFPSAHIYTVNAPADEQTGEITTFSLTHAEIGRVYRKYGLQKQVTQIFSNTLTMDLSAYLPTATVDLAIIDACHDTNYVLSDFRKILPFLSERAVVMLHDTDPSLREHLIGSYCACMTLRRQGFDIRHLRNTWWGVWTDWRRAEYLFASSGKQADRAKESAELARSYR